MDPHSHRRRHHPSDFPDRRLTELARAPTKRFNTARLAKILATGLIILPVLVTLSLITRQHPSDQTIGFADARILEAKARLNITASRLNQVITTVTARSPPTEKTETAPAPPNVDAKTIISSVINDPQPTEVPSEGKLLGGLLAAGFDEGSCLSRYQSFLHYKPSPHKPSPYLLSKLRNYEALHKRCGPYTENYNKTLKQLEYSNSTGSTDCKYVVWVAFSGLGNRVLSVTAVFLYALLTNRVMLIDRGKDMVDLFCEPFPKTSWLLPLDFPIAHKFDGFNMKSHECYGRMLNNNIISTSTNSSVPSYLYLHLTHDYQHYDKLFFCDQDQALLGRVPWLIIKTDNYFVPSLFLIQSFEKELGKLFPEKETVFHHLVRYLIHPTNHVWGLIIRYYQAYLAKADERIGIQVRVLDTRPGPFKYVMDQILDCTLKQKLLPQVDNDEFVIKAPVKPKLKAVLMTSLHSGYYEILRDMYWEHSTLTGDIVAVYQPSHEEYQQTEKKSHNSKALAEMYLLSLTDVLITSSWSTFGYIAQGLGGLRPWILFKPENETTPNPACRRDVSMEPCFHAPPFYDCRTKRGVDTGELVPHVRHCKDMSWGLKVVSADNW